MTTDAPPLPPSRELGGADCFLWALDGLMRRTGGEGNICRLALWLDAPLTAEALRAALRADEPSRWLARARLRRAHPFAVPCWQPEGQEDTPPVMEQAAQSFTVPLGPAHTPDLDARRDSPVRFDLIPSPDGAGTTLLLHWQHALMDSHGAELYLRHLGNALDPARPFLPVPVPAAAPGPGDRARRLRLLREAKSLLYDLCKPPFATAGASPGGEHRTVYRVEALTPQETALADQAAAAAGAGFVRSALPLAATARALRALRARRGLPEQDFLTSVPQDQRKRGAQGPALANTVAFLFLRIPAARLATPRDAVESIRTQFLDLMRKEFPAGSAEMMRFARRIPQLFYRGMLRSPTRGEMASCYFSDTGDSLSGFDAFLGRPVAAIRHFPPNVTPPGITVITSRHRASLSITLAHSPSVMSEEEAGAFLRSMREDFRP